MNHLLVKLALLFMLSPAVHAAEPGIFSLETSKTTYSVGEAATLTVRYHAAPESSDLEYYALSDLNGDGIRVTNAASNFAVAVSDPLLETGAFDWTVSVFVQDRKIASELQSSIAWLISENIRITDLIARTTDPGQVAALQKERDRNLTLISRAEQKLVEIRRPVSTPKFISINVI